MGRRCLAVSSQQCFTEKAAAWETFVARDCFADEPHSLLPKRLSRKFPFGKNASARQEENKKCLSFKEPAVIQKP